MKTLYSLDELIAESNGTLTPHDIKDYCRRNILHPCIHFEGNIVCIEKERFQDSIDRRDPIAHIDKDKWAKIFEGYIYHKDFISLLNTSPDKKHYLFKLHKIIAQYSSTPIPKLSDTQYIKVYPRRVDDDMKDFFWFEDFADFEGIEYTVNDIVFHKNEVEKLLLHLAGFSKNLTKPLDRAIDLGIESPHKKESSNIKSCIKLKDMLEDNDEYISVSSAFELIKKKTDLTSDTEIANFLIVNKINDLSTPFDKFNYFDGKPMPLYKNLQQNQITKMDLLLLEIAREELQLNNDDKRLKSFAWDRFDFFFEFKNLTNIDLEEEVIQGEVEKISSEKTLNQEENKADQSESELLLQDQSIYGNPLTGHTSLEHYQQQRELLQNENENLKAELIQAQKRIKQLESERLIEQVEINNIPSELKGLKRRNQLAQDRQGMARIIALSLWEKDKNILISKMADKVYIKMVDYCKDDLPGTSSTLKDWIRPVATEEAQKKGRPKSNT